MSGNEQPKLTIGVASSGLWKDDTVVIIAGIVGNAKWPTHFMVQRGCYVHENREKIILEAQRVQSTHVLFIDTDMWVEEGAVDRMLALDKDIVGLNYNQRGFPLISTVKFADEKGDLIAKAPADVPADPFPCYSIGTGFALIKMSVFEKIDKPWFYFDTYNGDIFGEDLWFCRQAYRKGLEVWCDPTIKVKHIGDYAY